ncbi:MAG: DUF6314 family protein [Aestuariivita sp.]|nr:DUF6314 family protein [Aestuariivita sp.]MCY4203678.1 DUF6314 family protein [Aestuariivita sp.]MCY4287010.1 DUF6314 family protein [Aestuariivita sp.]MCY4347657.1 DUF6314 family protein [Aestuariivita sp.]
MLATLERKSRQNLAEICLPDFCRQWTINRRILMSNKPYGTFIGSVTFSPLNDETQRYLESGTLHVPTTSSLAANRIYVWDRNLRIFFEDGCFFHQILTDGEEIRYECGSDRYRGRYNFDAWPIWEVTWSVTGPRKNYQLSSLYRPRTAYDRLKH